MLIRAASTEDLTRISELHALSWQQNYQQALSAEFLQKHVQADRNQLWKQRLHQPKSKQHVLVAEQDGHFCGFICVFRANHSKYGAIIDNLHVSPQKKGQGIGCQLMLAAAQWLDEVSPEHGVYLEVLACNTKAIEFYRSRSGKNAACGYWLTPCGNKVEEFIYTWSTPKMLIEACL